MRPKRLAEWTMPDQQELTARFLASRHGLFGFIYGLTRNPEDAEDLLQEVWLRFSAAVERGTTIEEPARWCRATAKNLILHYWRDRKNAKVIVDNELFELVELAFAEQDSQQELWEARRRALAECIESLPEKSKRLVTLKYGEGQAAETVGRSLNQSAAGVLMALSRIRRVLQQCAEEKLKSLGFGP